MSGKRTFFVIVPFDTVRLFSVAYMDDHCRLDAPLEPNLVYLQDLYDGTVRMGLVSSSGQVLPSDPFGTFAAHTAYHSDGCWRGYSQECPFGFRWQSCSGSLMSAVRSTEHSGQYVVTCTHAHRQSGTCGFMMMLEDFGVVEWTELTSADSGEPEPEKAGGTRAGDDDRELESSWYGGQDPADRLLGRSSSNC